MDKFEEKFSFSTNKESFKLYRTWTSGFSLYPSSPLNLLSQQKSFYLLLTVCVKVILLVFSIRSLSLMKPNTNRNLLFFISSEEKNTLLYAFIRILSSCKNNCFQDDKLDIVVSLGPWRLMRVAI